MVEADRWIPRPAVTEHEIEDGPGFTPTLGAVEHAFATVRACLRGIPFEFPGACSYPARQQKRQPLVNGNLRLIRNESLKAKVVEYYSGLVTGEGADSRVTPPMWYDVAITPYAMKLVSILPPGDWFRWNTEGPSDLDVDAVVRALREDPEITQHLEACRRIRTMQLAKFRIHEGQAVALLAAVSSELNRLSSGHAISEGDPSLSTR